jgi:hypothetical protein
MHPVSSVGSRFVPPPIMRKTFSHIVDLDEADFAPDLMAASIQYAGRMMSHNQLCGATPQLDREQHSRLRSAIFDSFDMVVGYKMANFAAIGRKVCPRKVFQAYGMTKADADAYSYVMASLVEPTREKLDKHPDVKFRHPENVRKDCARLLSSPRIDEFVNKFVWRKLRKFAEAERATSADMKQDLLARGVRVHYYMTPLANPDHIISSIQKSIKHHGHEIIMHHIAKRRRRLISDPDTGRAGNSQRDLFSVGADGFQFIDPAIEQAALDMNNVIDPEMSIMLQRLLAVQTGERKRAVISLMMLDDSPAFVAWWNKRRRKDVESVSDIYHACKNPEAFFEAIRKFMRVPADEYAAFLQSLSL